MKRILLTFTTLLILLLPVWAGAADYYVKQTAAGGDTGADCANAKSLSWFNANASGDDTAILCDDTYTTPITPATTGTSGHRITYIADNQYDAVITTSSYGSNLTSKDYITIDGLYFNDSGSRWILIAGSDYNIIQNCKFYDSDAYGGILFDDGSKYNKILNNIFSDAPLNVPMDNAGSRPADMININYDDGVTHNVVEGNTFGRSAHGTMGLYSAQNWVIRNNTFHNRLHTSMGPGGHALVEDNYIYDCGLDRDLIPNEGTDFRRINQPGIQVEYDGGIIRRNIINNCGTGISANYSLYSPATHGSDMRIYNNTIYKATRAINAHYFASYEPCYSINDNKYKNNSFTHSIESIWAGLYEETDASIIPYNLYFRESYSPALPASGNEFYNNNFFSPDEVYFRSEWTILSSTIDDMDEQFPGSFPDTSNIASDPNYTDAANADFTLQSDSSNIDAGTHLTLTNGTGAPSAALIVDDASYFYDGWGIPGETADTIYVAAATPFSVLITDVTGNTITLASAQTWEDGVAVYHCPSGVCFSGSAPDIGANEYGGTPQNSPPTITSVLPGNTDLYADGGAGWNEMTCSSTISDDSAVASQLWDFGIEYLTDGTMETNPTTNWTASGSTLSEETTIKYADSKSLKATDEGNGVAYQTITTEIGAKYRVNGYAYRYNGSGITIKAGTAINTSNLGYEQDMVTTGSWLDFSFDLTATGTTSYINLCVWGSPEDGSIYGFFDNVTMRMISTVEDPGTVTIPDPGSYPTAYTVTVDATDDLEASATQQSFTVTVKATSDVTGNIFTGRANALWKLDDGALTTDSIGSYTLTNNNTVTNDTGDYQEGNASGQFTAADNEYLYRAGTTSDFGWDSGTGCTVCLWLEGDTSTLDHWLWVKASATKYCLGFYYNLTPKFMVYLGYNSGDAVEYLNTSNTMTDDQWYHACFGYNKSDKAYQIRTWDDTGSVIHENITGNTTNDWAAFNEDGEIWIGRTKDSSTTDFNGKLDEIVVFDRKITQDEMDAVRSQQFPLAIMGEIVSVSGDGPYGIDGTITVAIHFTRDGNPVAVTWTDGGTDSSLTATPDAGAAMTLTHVFPASTVASSVHEYTGTVVAGQTEADLDISAFNLEQGTFTYGSPAINISVTLPSSPNRLQDNAAIVIDTTATSLSIATIALCDSDGVALGVDTTNSTIGTVYASITLAGSELGFFSNGPILDLGIPLDLSLGTCVLRYAGTQPTGWGVGHNEWLFEGVLEIGDRDDGSECVLDATAMTRPLGTKIIDGGSNELSDYDWPSTDILSGFTWRVLIPGVFTVGTAKDYPLWSNGSTGFDDLTYDIDGDRFHIYGGITDDFTPSAEVYIRGTDRNTEVTGSCTANNCIIRCITFSGGIAGAGNTYLETCQGQMID